MWFLFFKQKTAYEMRISDWSSDVCSSDRHDDPRAWRGDRVGVVAEIGEDEARDHARARLGIIALTWKRPRPVSGRRGRLLLLRREVRGEFGPEFALRGQIGVRGRDPEAAARGLDRLGHQRLIILADQPSSEEHTSELPSLMRI